MVNIFYKLTPNPSTILFKIEEFKFSNFPIAITIGKKISCKFSEIFNKKIFINLIIYEDYFSLTIKDPDEWTKFVPIIILKIRQFLEKNADLARKIIPIEIKRDKTEAGLIMEKIFKFIIPEIERHGGIIEIISLKDKLLKIKLGGACSGCDFNNKAFREKIERTIKILLNYDITIEWV